MTPQALHPRRTRRRRERGQMVPLVAIFGVAILGATAIATDLSVSTHFKRSLQNVTDAAALAGAKVLPVTVTSANQVAATQAALQVMHNSYQWPLGGPLSNFLNSVTNSGCAGSQCSVTICAGLTSSCPAGGRHSP